MSNGTRLRVAGLLLFMSGGLPAGCVSSSPSMPSSQQPLPTGSGPETVSVASVTLSGVVYEMTPRGRVPVEGVQVIGDYFHVFPTPNVVTDANGFFSFKPVWVCPCSWAPWVDAGITSIWVDKEGYEAPAEQPASVFSRRLDPGVRPDLRLRDVTISGDTRMDIQLVRR